MTTRDAGTKGAIRQRRAGAVVAPSRIADEPGWLMYYDPVKLPSESFDAEGKVLECPTDADLVKLAGPRPIAG